MKNAFWVIFRKEVRSFFLRPSSFAVLFICSLYLTFNMSFLLFQFAQASFSMQSQGGVNVSQFFSMPHINSLNFLLLFCVPFFVLRLFVEEKKMNTMALLLTSPITSWQIVGGKFFAALVSMHSIVAFSFLYFIPMIWFLELPWLEIFCGYLGILLLAGIYISIGLFASSLTSSVFLGGFLSILMSLFLWIFVSFKNLDPGLWSEGLNQLWIGTHFTELLQAKISLAGVSFLLSLILFFLFLTQQTVESMRWR